MNVKDWILEFEETGDGAAITVTSDVFAKGVFLDFRQFDCVLSDNFFDITNSAPYRIIARIDRPIREVADQLIVKSVYDIR